MAGNGTVRAMWEKVEALKSGIISLAGEAMLEKKDEIVALVVNQQQEKHEDSTGASLRPYSKRYRLYKQELGKSGDTDFDLTGEMHSEMDLTVDGDTYYIDSPATTNTGELKSTWLKRWQKAPVMDLTDENKKLAWEIIREPFMEKVNSVLVID